jgi:predicted nucleotidyltransferase
MDAAEIRTRLLGHAEQLRRQGVLHLALFGSVARGEADERSDVDVLIDLQPDRRFTLFDLGEVRSMLVDLLDRDVDVVIAEDLSPPLKSGISRDSMPVF